jgi:hypothetical protein
MGTSPIGPPICDEGVERKVVKDHITQGQAVDAVQRWWHSRLMARDLKNKGMIIECRLRYVPYWKIRAKIDGYVDGVVDDSGETYVSKMREKKTVKGSITWTKIAIDATDIGIDYLKRPDIEVQLYDERIGHLLYATFSKEDALSMCSVDIEKTIITVTRIEKVIAKQVNVLPVDQLIIFYPLWIVKYDYAGITYPVTVDGVTGKILAGKAPGDPLLRKISLIVSVASVIIMALFMIWALFYRSDACCPVMILEFICFVIAINASNYYSYGSEIIRGVSNDTYGPPYYEGQMNQNLTINELKTDTISSVRV